MIDKLSLTLAILKPDVVKVPFVLQEIRHRIVSAGFFVVRSRQVNLTNVDAENFYLEHKGRFFHNRLVTFMQSGPIQAYILAHPNATQLWRNLMGPTKTFRAQYEAATTIRGTYGLTDTRNSAHGSDSFTSASREIHFFFPDFNVTEWYDKEEMLLRRGSCYFNEDIFKHFIISQSTSSSN